MTSKESQTIIDSCAQYDASTNELSNELLSIGNSSGISVDNSRLDYISALKYFFGGLDEKGNHYRFTKRND